MGAGSPASGSPGELWCALSLRQENASRLNCISGQETRRWMCFPRLAYLAGSASHRSPALFVCARLLARGQEMIRQQTPWRSSPELQPAPALPRPRPGREPLLGGQTPALSPRAGCSCTGAAAGEGGGRAAGPHSCSGTARRTECGCLSAPPGTPSLTGPLRSAVHLCKVRGRTVLPPSPPFLGQRRQQCLPSSPADTRAPCPGALPHMHPLVS